MLLIVLVIFGPKRLPHLGRSLGSGMREFKDAVTGKHKDDEPEEIEARCPPPDNAARREHRRPRRARQGRRRLLAPASAVARGPIAHEDRLTLVEHLDELRTRIVVSVCAFVVALGLCFWQNDLLLKIVNEPLPEGFTPITLGVAEPFTTTLTVAAYSAILISLPMLLYQLYAFVLPAFSPTGAAGGAAADADGAGALHRRRGVRVLRRHPGGAEVPARLQRRPVQHRAARA